jgi:hypothetical protein
MRDWPEGSVADASRPRQTSRKVTTRPQVTGFPTALLLFAGKSATAYQSKMLRVIATRAAAVGPQDGKRRAKSTRVCTLHASSGRRKLPAPSGELPVPQQGAPRGPWCGEARHRARLSERALPSRALRRCLGEYAGGGLCDGRGERITSAQASYAVEFTPVVTPQSVRLHRPSWLNLLDGNRSASCCNRASAGARTE